jgi:hypothetical protein
MITFDAFLMFLLGAALPVIYLTICSRWIEPAYRDANWSPRDTQPNEPVLAPRRPAGPTMKGQLTRQAA